MKKLVTVSAILFIFILTAGFASAFETTPNDGFIYLLPPGLTTSETTLLDSSTAPANSFQVELVDATANPLAGTKYTGQELFSGIIILPVGASNAGVTINISAINDPNNKLHWTYKGTNNAILVTGEIYSLGKLKDETVVPAVLKPAYGVYGYVSGNTNFNGAFRGVFYVE